MVPEYSAVEFRRIFRMSYNTFQIIYEYMKDCEELVNTGTGGREPVSVEKQLLVTLFYLGNQDTILKIADRFNISESTVISSRNRVINAIVLHLKPKFISWPYQNELQIIKDYFQRKNGFPGIVGCIDGTHIEIPAPKESPKSYVNRKGYHSLQLQAVCREDMRFTHCFMGFPGSCHDSRVLKNSDIWENGNGLCGNDHIVGDGGYPLTRWLLTPYRDNGNLTPDQRNYNHLLSSNRVVIERAFGLLKGRFRRLKYLATAEIETALTIIMACCVIHNVCILQSDAVEEFLQQDNNVVNNIPVHVPPIVNEGVVKRNTVATNLPR